MRKLQDWISKPPAGTPLRSDGHWSVQGLVGAWAFNEGTGAVFNCVSNRQASTQNNVVLAAGDAVFNGSNSYIRDNSFANQFSNKFTVISSLRGSDVAASSTIFSVSRKFGFKYEQYSNQNKIGFTKYNVGDYVSTLACPNGVDSSLSLVGNEDNTASLYVNGILIQSLGTTTPYYSTTPPLAIIIGAGLPVSDTVSDYFSGTIKQLLYFTRSLTPAEVASLSANPWQIFEPRTVISPNPIGYRYRPCR